MCYKSFIELLVCAYTEKSCCKAFSISERKDKYFQIKINRWPLRVWDREVCILWICFESLQLNPPHHTHSHIHTWTHTHTHTHTCMSDCQISCCVLLQVSGGLMTFPMWTDTVWLSAASHILLLHPACTLRVCESVFVFLCQHCFSKVCVCVCVCVFCACRWFI